MILLQQPRLLPASVQLHKPLSRKSSITGKKINGSYLPILNSYPRIAPHPSKKPPDKSSSNDESQNLSKRICTEHNKPVTISQPELHLYKQPKLPVLTSGMPCSSSIRDSRPSSSLTTVSSSRSSVCSTSSILSTRGLHRNGTTSARHHRFFNTVEILRQSGLLDITLRTKELMRQSSDTEQSIAQLRQHTELLCQAASNPGCSPSDIAAWEYLHRAMAESDSYPNLKILQNLHIPFCPDSASQPASVYTGDANGPQAADESSGVPPSRLLTTIPDPNGDKSSEKGTFMSPDSSTG